MLPILITREDLARRIGVRGDTAILDVRTDEDAAADPRLMPAAHRRPALDVAAWGEAWTDEHRDQLTVAVCQKGLKLSQGVAAWLRHQGASAVALAGGFDGWVAAGSAVVCSAAVPRRDARGRTVWVTRARPKVDRIACPWLIRRFVDPSAVFLFVPPDDVAAVAERFGATPFDVPDVRFSHRGDMCTFDTMLDEFGLTSPPLDRLAAIVRGADEGRFDQAPQAAGLLALSLGFSRLFDDDLEQLSQAMTVYDALYLWCRDGVSETHGWPPSASSKVPQ